MGSALATAKDVGVRLLTRLGLFRPVFDGYQALRAAGPRAFLGGGRGADGLPLPSPRLLVATAGTAEVGWFLERGAEAAAVLGESLGRHGESLEGIGRVLDFGCGCGRVLRHLAHLDGGRLYGTDLDPRAVAWCRRHLPFARVDRNRLAPPLPHPAGHFGLIYALSVLTHLTAEQQCAWVEEWRRMLAPGGALLFTSHGEPYRDELGAEERRFFDAGRLVVRHAPAAGSNRCGAYHPPGWVRGNLLAGFELLEHLPAGARGNPRQDLWLARRI